MPLDRHLNPDSLIQIWRTARDGDQTSLENLLRGQQDRIYRFCYSQLGEVTVATDATQETAMRMIQRLATFSGEHDSQLIAWTLGIANNVCREFRRREGRWRVVAQEPESEFVVGWGDFLREPQSRFLDLRLVGSKKSVNLRISCHL